EALIDQGEPVRVLDNLVTGRETNLAVLKGRAQIIRGDLRNFEAVKAAVEGVEVVFHQGALGSVPRSIADPVTALENHINGKQNVLLAALDAGVRRVVYASSSSIYGNT